MIKADLTLTCPMGNKEHLIVRESDDGDLSYTLKGTGSTSFSINNLQLIQPLPAWSDAPLSILMGEIKRIVEQGVYRVLDIKTRDKKPDNAMWIINTESRSFDFFVLAETEAGCMRAFSKMWNDWCKKTGADPYYWGEAGDKWSEITPERVVIGQAYMDREIYR